MPSIKPVLHPIRFNLCADDFGISPGVCTGILNLASRKRLSAVSCMMNQPHTTVWADKLKAYEKSVDIGIHLVLTGQTNPGSPNKHFPTINQLILKSLSKNIDIHEIRLEISRQLEAFIKLFGRPPDFVDGHHHIQQLPIIRDVVIDLILQHFSPNLPLIRCCHEPLFHIIKRRIAPVKAASLSHLGKTLKQLALSKGIRVNNGFRGVYNFSSKKSYSAIFERLVTDIQPGTIIMCHPGEVDDELLKQDSLTTQRLSELRFFQSDDFVILLRRKNLAIAKLSTTLDE